MSQKAASQIEAGDRVIGLFGTLEVIAVYPEKDGKLLFKYRGIITNMTEKTVFNPDELVNIEAV